MDPWKSVEVGEGDLQPLDLSSTPADNNNSTPQFDDHFNLPFQKLPDSEQYLESLHKKLQKIQSGRESKADILKFLREKKEYCLDRLIAESSTYSDAEPFDELKVNPLLKKIAPERQAIASEELVHLVAADQLDQNTQPIPNPEESADLPEPPQEQKPEENSKTTEVEQEPN